MAKSITKISQWYTILQENPDAMKISIDLENEKRFCSIRPQYIDIYTKVEINGVPVRQVVIDAIASNISTKNYDSDAQDKTAYIIFKESINPELIYVLNIYQQKYESIIPVALKKLNDMVKSTKNKNIPKNFDGFTTKSVVLPSGKYSDDSGEEHETEESFLAKIKWNNDSVLLTPISLIESYKGIDKERKIIDAFRDIGAYHIQGRYLTYQKFAEYMGGISNVTNFNDKTSDYACRQTWTNILNHIQLLSIPKNAKTTPDSFSKYLKTLDDDNGIPDLPHASDIKSIFYTREKMRMILSLGTIRIANKTISHMINKPSNFGLQRIIKTSSISLGDDLEEAPEDFVEEEELQEVPEEVLIVEPPKEEKKKRGKK